MKLFANTEGTETAAMANLVLSREQIFRIAEALSESPEIERVDLSVDASKKLRVNAVVVQETLKPIRLSSKPNKNG